MKKKELKDFINSKGFFFHINNVETIEADKLNFQENSFKTNAKVPQGENIVIFRGKATQQFGQGEMSRNMYKIDVKGWDWKNYIKNPQILLQHDDNKPIGKTLEIIPQQDGIEIVYFVDLNSLNKEDAHRVKTGLFSALSTGHITKEMQFESIETGKRLLIAEFRQLSWEEQQKYVFVVSSAEAIEVSVVSIPSNPDALTAENSLKLFFSKVDGIKKSAKDDEENDDSEEEGPDLKKKKKKKQEDPEKDDEEENAKKKKEEDDDKEPDYEDKDEEEETGEDPEKKKKVKKSSIESEESENSGEKPEAKVTPSETPSEKPEATKEVKEDKIKISLADRNKLKDLLESTYAEGEEEQTVKDERDKSANARAEKAFEDKVKLAINDLEAKLSKETKEIFTNFLQIVKDQQKEIDYLQKVVAKIPERRGYSYVNKEDKQTNAIKATNPIEALEAVGVTIGQVA